MVSINEYREQATQATITVGQGYLKNQSLQGAAFYQLSRAIADEIITTLAEAGIASEHELKSLLAATGISLNLPEENMNQGADKSGLCPYCTQQT